MKSMTGYGRGESVREGITVTVEIKTVNHRFFEPGIRMPRKLFRYENLIKQLVKKRVLRGKTDILVTYENKGADSVSVEPDFPRISAYVDALRLAGEKYGLKDNLGVAELLRVEDAFVDKETEDDEELISAMLEEAINRALDGLNVMREKEGLQLKNDLTAKIAFLEGELEEIEKAAPEVPKNYRVKLESRIAGYLSPDNGADPARLEQELAIFADKCCIDEEITRLKSHFRQFIEIMNEKEEGAYEGCGKRLDFLTQELNRETNTISSKASELAITKHALKMKNEIEKIREQIQNLE